jgi:hypothetical protein
VNGAVPSDEFFDLTGRSSNSPPRTASDLPDALVQKPIPPPIPEFFSTGNATDIRFSFRTFVNSFRDTRPNHVPELAQRTLLSSY